MGPSAQELKPPGRDTCLGGRSGSPGSAPPPPARRSGTTEIWKKALASFEPAFAAQIGTSSQPAWAFATHATPPFFRDTNAGVGAFVSVQPYSMGYSVLSEATALGLDAASLRKGSVTIESAASAPNPAPRPRLRLACPTLAIASIDTASTPGSRHPTPTSPPLSPSLWQA